MSRDLIDHAVLTDDDGRLDPAGMTKARRAYGPSVLIDLQKACANLLDDHDRLRDRIRKLGVHVPEAALRARIQSLASSL
ncbi:hypothetical protein [Piscinibacter sakaiensis]|uniref:hypothetical protein n=1 Tax=Piscinibacter sakaiensis TaxID=1547922 RepID=UPI003AAC11FD